MTCGCETATPLVKCRTGWTTPRLQTEAAMIVAGEQFEFVTDKPDDIRLRWCQAVWRGTPAPVGWKLWLILLDEPMKGKLPGCGCVDRWKTWWESALRWFTMK